MSAESAFRALAERVASRVAATLLHGDRACQPKPGCQFVKELE